MPVATRKLQECFHAIQCEAQAVVSQWVSDVTIIIPTLNEQKSISALIGAVHRLYPRASVIVVDDGSVDGTCDVVRDAIDTFTGNKQGAASLRLIDRKKAPVKGLTASVLEGIRQCSTKYFIVMDGDLQHPPEHVADIFAEVQKGADLVVACRLPYREVQTPLRRFITLVSTEAAKRRLASKNVIVRDPMSGFFGGRTDLVKRIILEFPYRFEFRGYKVLFDLLKIVDSSCKVQVTHYRFGVRPEGSSKLRAVHALYFLRSLFI